MRRRKDFENNTAVIIVSILITLVFNRKQRDRVKNFLENKN